jgi:hypothetical protein
MLEQSLTGRTYTRDAHASVRRDAHPEMEKINVWLHTSAFSFSNFEESVAASISKVTVSVSDGLWHELLPVSVRVSRCDVEVISCVEFSCTAVSVEHRLLIVNGTKRPVFDPDGGYSTVDLVGLNLQNVHDVISDYKTKDGAVNTNVALAIGSSFWRGAACSSRWGLDIFLCVLESPEGRTENSPGRLRYAAARPHLAAGSSPSSGRDVGLRRA